MQRGAGSGQRLLRSGRLSRLPDQHSGPEGLAQAGPWFKPQFPHEVVAIERQPRDSGRRPGGPDSQERVRSGLNRPPEAAPARRITSGSHGAAAHRNSTASRPGRAEEDDTAGRALVRAVLAAVWTSDVIGLDNFSRRPTSGARPGSTCRSSPDSLRAVGRPKAPSTGCRRRAVKAPPAAGNAEARSARSPSRRSSDAQSAATSPCPPASGSTARRRPNPSQSRAASPALPASRVKIISMSVRSGAARSISAAWSQTARRSDGSNTRPKT